VDSSSGNILAQAKSLSAASDSECSSSDNDPESTFEPLSALDKPKGLVDGLSKFFTPSDKRKSRVSLSSSATLVQIKSSKPKSNVLSQNKNHSQSRKAATKLIRKSKLYNVHRKRRRLGEPPGSGQLKGLFDGLSHIFAAQGERKKSLPVYNNSKKRKKSVGEHMLDDFNCDNSLTGITTKDTKTIRHTVIDGKIADIRLLQKGRGRGRGRGRGSTVGSASPESRQRQPHRESHPLLDGYLSDQYSSTSMSSPACSVASDWGLHRGLKGKLQPRRTHWLCTVSSDIASRLLVDNLLL